MGPPTWVLSACFLFFFLPHTWYFLQKNLAFISALSLVSPPHSQNPLLVTVTCQSSFSSMSLKNVDVTYTISEAPEDIDP